VNVYDHIDSNNRRTLAILCAFPVALFVVVFVFFFLLADVIQVIGTGGRYFLFLHTLTYSIENIMQDSAVLDQHLAGMGIVTDATRAEQALQSTFVVYPWIILAAFLWIAISYRKGDAMVFRMIGARRIAPGENRELVRMVENTAIMAGLPTPEIYLIDDKATNALAAGRSPDTASIALTRGLIEKLSKAELQAVIAHELAHIGNRDTRLMQITIEGIGFFIFFGELMIGGSLLSRGKASKTRNILLLIVGAAFLLFGYFVAPILRFALSRRREYQADATAVKITRDADTLSQALSKIAINPHVEVLSGCPLTGNMCVVDPTNTGRFSLMRGLYATHPSIEDRLSALKKMTGRQDVQAGQGGQSVNGRQVTGRVIDFH